MTASTAAPTAAPEPPAPTAAVDDSKCPIPGNELWRYFDEVNTPQQVFDAEAPEGAAFREAMTLSSASVAAPALASTV
ncbi:hypothetical protein PC123_g29051 [Phytophthora cactorum]|nr:hypothetical protein PC123_g29051 [Phytophthora cactorum]